MTKFNEPWRDGDPDEVTAVLRDLPQIEPPPALVDSVMSTITRGSVSHATTSITSLRKGKTMAKKVLWSVAAAAAVALVVMRILGYPPVENGTEATIGAAQRYQAPQIQSTDVKLQDAELQAFLQSDVFRQLAADKAAQQALKNKDFQRALADASIRAALAAPDVQAAIASVSSNAAADARLEAAGNAGAAARIGVVQNAALDAALRSSDALRAALAAPGVAEAIANSSLGAALSRADVAFALSQDAAVNAVLQAASVSLDAAAASSNAAPNAAKDAAAK
jgi:hypothetical protein